MTKQIYDKFPITNKALLSIKFEDIFALCPKTKSKVRIYDKKNGVYYDRTVNRSYVSYLNTPNFKPEVNKSYMHLNQETRLPDILAPYLEYAKTIDNRYNQITINFYEPEDFIDLHRDCTAGFIYKDAPILTINLNERSEVDTKRTLLFTPIEAGSPFITDLLWHNFAYIIKDNTNYRHAVSTGSEKRVSITFRMMKE